MGNTYNAIVLDGGHNGLVAAAYAGYRRPVDGLDISSSATHDGGACLVPGMQAAMAARRWPRRLIGRAGR